MIKITRDVTKVAVLIEGGPLDSVYQFSFDCGDKHYAELLRDHFDIKFRQLIQDIRMLEYEQGYKDGRAKRGKKRVFYWNLNRKA
jgi:hypothetical protein